MNNQIFVGNLSWDTTEADLKDLFGAYGDIITVKIMTDRESEKPRGFAFVTMSSPDAATSAIAALSGREFRGRQLTVNEAREKDTGAAGGITGRDRDRTNRARQGGRGGGDSFSGR